METERRQYTPDPIEPERVIPDWMANTASTTINLALDVTYLIFSGWLMVNLINSMYTQHYKNSECNRTCVEERLKRDGYVGIRKVDDFLYSHGKLGRQFDYWLDDTIGKRLENGLDALEDKLDKLVPPR